MNLHITRLKILLQSKYVCFSLLGISLLFSFICINNNIFYSKYNVNSTSVVGIIKRIDTKDNYTYLYIDDLIIKTNNNQDYKAGYKVEVYGVFSIPNKKNNFYQFDYKNYLYSKKIHYIVKAKRITILSNNTNYLYKIKSSINSYISKRKSNKYLNAFILGNSSLIEDEVIVSYKFNGIIHLFSISGMHTSIFSGVLIFILNKIMKNKILIYLIVSSFLLFYCFLTSFGMSSIRALILFICLFINKYYKLDIKKNYILIYIFSIMLFINPFNIYNSGFLYSYIISFYLLKYCNKNSNKFKSLLNVSIISFLAGLPISINNNFSINALSIFINLLYVPIVSLLIFPLSILTFVIPFIDNIFIVITSCMENTSLFIYKFKIFNITLCHISIYSFIIYYIIITIVIKYISINRFEYIFVIVIILFIHNNIRYFDIDYKIHFINIGQGDSILITLPYNKSNILIDCGISSNSNNTITTYLKSFGIKKIEYLIITHGDTDHMGEAINLVNNFKVVKVIFNCGPYNDLEEELIKVLEKKKIPYYSCIKELNIDKNKLYFLQTKEYDNENDNSNVIYTEINDYKFMFMGDAGIDKEKDILDKYNISDIDVLKVGHHGSKTSSSGEFINEIKPKYSIISVGKNNRYGHPNKEVLNNLEDSKIYRTDQDGSIMFKIKNNKLKIETCAP